MKLVSAVCGAKFEIMFALSEKGHPSAYQVFQSLDKVTQAAFHTSMKRLAETGNGGPRERFKKVEGTDLWEFKKHRHRFLGFYLPKRRFVIASYEEKKKDKLNPATIKRAESIKKQLKGEEVAARGR